MGSQDGRGHYFCPSIAIPGSLHNLAKEIAGRVNQEEIGWRGAGKYRNGNTPHRWPATSNACPVAQDLARRPLPQPAIKVPDHGFLPQPTRAKCARRLIASNHLPRYINAPM